MDDLDNSIIAVFNKRLKIIVNKIFNLLLFFILIIYCKIMIKALIFDLNGVVIDEKGLNSKLIELVQKKKELGVKSFILSNNSAEWANFYKVNFPILNKVFDKIYYSFEIGFIKPEKGAFDFVLIDQALKPQECIFFDDILDNIKIASGLGIHAYLYRDYKNLEGILEREVSLVV